MKFCKKPVEVEAIQYDGGVEGYNAVARWAMSLGATPFDVDSTWDLVPSRCVDELIIPTLEGDMRASVGDWIICGIKGEFYPCKPDIFEATYEPVGVNA